MALSTVLMRPRSRIVGPVPVSGLGLWLDASNGASLTFNGNTVSEWRDLSGNNRHFSQATAALQPNGVNRTYNGLRVLDFDGTQLLEGNSAALGLASNVTGITFVAVAKWDAAVVGLGSASRLFAFNNALPITARLSFFLAAAGFVFRHRDTDTTADPSGRDVTYLPQGVTDTNVFSGVLDLEAAVASAYFGGSMQQSMSGWESVGRLPDTDSSASVVGGIGVPLQQGLDGFIGEMLVYRRALSDYQRSLVEQYLLAKWNPQPEPPVIAAARSLWNVETLEPVYHWSL